MRSGYKTTEFWLALIASVVAFLMGSGAVGDDSLMGKVLAFAAAALTALGYTASRAVVKKAETLREAAATLPPPRAEE